MDRIAADLWEKGYKRGSVKIYLSRLGRFSQAWLGHSEVATTHRYAAADVEMMRRGLDKAGIADKHPAQYQPKDAVLRLLEVL